MFGFKFYLNKHHVSVSYPMDEIDAAELGIGYCNSRDMYVECVQCGKYLEYRPRENDLGKYVCSECGIGVMEMTLLNQIDKECKKFEEGIIDVMPRGCSACGGPYPDCMVSCKMFE